MKAQVSNQKGFVLVKIWYDRYGSGIWVAPTQSITFSETNALSPLNPNVPLDSKTKEEHKGNLLSTN